MNPSRHLTTRRQRVAGVACMLGMLLSAQPGVVGAQSGAPGAGSLMKEMTPSTKTPAAAGAPDLALPRAVAAPLVGGPTLRVAGFRLAGLDESRAQALLPLLARYIGDGKTLIDLEDAAKDVEVALQRQGLFLAQVFVPEQTLQDGVVVLQVLEGRIGQVTLRADDGVRVDAAMMDRFLDPLRNHPVATRERVERALFALGDLRGVEITSALEPGQRTGHADLTVRVAPGARAAFEAGFDNGGSIFTGRYRLTGSADWLSPTGRGDSLSIKALASTNGGVVFARAAWLTPVGSVGTKFGLAASALSYKLGSPVFEPLQASGTGQALGVQLLHPARRARNSNLFLQAGFDHRRFADDVDAIDLRSRKSVASYVSLGAVGDFRDTLGGGGISNYAVNLVTGRLSFKSADDIAVDQASYQTAGSYAKLVLTASRLQALPNKDHLYLSAQAQFAGKDLDSSEKQSLGGPSGVRAYPAPDTPSDSAVIVGWEYRKTLPIEAYPGDWVLSLFGDYAVGRQHESPLPADTDNVRRLVGHGLGLTYASRAGLLVKGWVAVRGGRPAQSDDSRARAYVQLSQQF